MPSSLDCREIRDLEVVRPAWDALLGSVQCRAFHHRWEWHRAVSEHLFPGQIAHHCFYEGQRLVAVFPMLDGVVTGPPSVRRVLHAPVHPEIFVSDALIDPAYGPAVEPLLQRVMALAPRKIDVLCFKRVPARSCLGGNVELRDSALVRRIDGGSAYCDCTSTDSLSHLSGKHLQNVHRLRRRAERDLGAVERVVFRGGGASGEGLDRFMHIEAASWKGPGGEGTSLSCMPVAQAFYRGVLSEFGKTGDARVDVLCIGGAPAAALLAVRNEGTWSLLKIGFDESLSACGPGNILLLMFIEEMAQDPTVHTVSLTTAPDWASRWHMQVDPTYEVSLPQRTWRMWVHSFLHMLRGRARRLRRRRIRLSWRTEAK